MLGKILSLLGVGNGVPLISSVVGGVNYVTIASLTTWAWLHRDEQITFTLSLGTLGIIVAVALFYLELNRRIPPPTHPN